MSSESFSTLEYARSLDSKDELSGFREEFYIQPGTIYLDGNSLGLLSRRAEAMLLSLLNSWKQYGIDGWTKGDHPWFYLSEKLGEMSAPLVGAAKEEVIVTGSTTGNLHQLAATFFRPAGKRSKILADELTFPTDLYALQSQLELKGLDPDTHLVKVRSGDGRYLDEEAIIEKMTDEVAMAVLPSVLYRSGQILDMELLAKEARSRGIIIGFDLCHSIGSIPHSLSGWGADFAFWCNYKHLNGGPGAVGGLFVNSRHFGASPGLAGWFGSNKEVQFDLKEELEPAGTAGAYQMGTPHVLSAAPLLGSLEMFKEAGIPRIRSKSLALTDYLMSLLDHELAGYGFMIANPKTENKRGGHVFLEHPEAARICKALKAAGVIPDFRAPNGIRLAPVALYNSFEDVWNTIQILRSIMQDELYKKYKNVREVVA